MRFFHLIIFPLLMLSCNGHDPAECVDEDAKAPAGHHPADTSAARNTAATPIYRDSAATDTVNATQRTLPALAGEVYFNTSYCGGVAPTAEMIEELKKYHALKSSIIILKKDGVKYEVSTDADGNFSMALPEGDYKIYLHRKTKGCEYKTADVFQSPVGNVTMKANATNKLYFTIPCDISERMRP